MPSPKDPVKREKWIQNISIARNGMKCPWTSDRNKREDIRKKNSKKLRGKHHTIETRLVMSIAHTGKRHDYERRMKQMEGNIGGFWYGNVRYPVANGKKYCNMWKRLRNSGRIGACWGFKSVLSGKIEDLCYHHIYYQEKACCQWDEDIQGYYAWIDVGTRVHPKMYKYYIDGDPNKFVPLTRSENSIVNYNKLEWIKIFENVIKEHGSKSYLTKEEMKDYTRVNGGE